MRPKQSSFMSVDSTTPGIPKDRQIDPDQIDWWAQSLQVTPFQLREAIVCVGYRLSSVRRYLEEIRGERLGRSGQGTASMLPHLQRQAQAQTRPADLYDELKRNDS